LIVDAQNATKQSKQKPAADHVPLGNAAVGAFQMRLTKLAGRQQMRLDPVPGFGPDDTFHLDLCGGAQASGTWVQVEVKINLQGTTRAVMDTLRNLDKVGIPYEFTSLDMSRTTASASGEATVTANVSLESAYDPGRS